MNQMVINNKHPSENFGSNSFSSELMSSDELIVDLDDLYTMVRKEWGLEAGTPEEL